MHLTAESFTKMNGIYLQNAYTKKWVAYTTLTVTLTQKNNTYGYD